MYALSVYDTKSAASAALCGSWCYISVICYMSFYCVVCRTCRDKRIAHLIVDDDLVTGVSSVGATTLDTDGQLWIGMSLVLTLHQSFTSVSTTELSLGWVDPQVGLGRYWVRNFCFQLVGLAHGSEMADLRKMSCRVYM